jgi:hypothetical protein
MISESDIGFTSTRCSTWTQDLSAITASQILIPNGTFVVGTDIQPGTYRTRVSSAACYFARHSGFDGTTAAIIANDITDVPSIVTIAATDKAFESNRCGVWTQDLSPITESRTSFGDGVFIVGAEIEPGTYRTTGATGSCYFARLRGFSASLSDIIANSFGNAAPVVTIAQSDQGFESSHCGVWEPL